MYGIIHGFGGFVFFTTGPVGLLLVYGKLSARVLAVPSVFAIAYASLARSAVLALNSGELGERIILGVIF